MIAVTSFPFLLILSLEILFSSSFHTFVWRLGWWVDQLAEYHSGLAPTQIHAYLPCSMEGQVSILHEKAGPQLFWVSRKVENRVPISLFLNFGLESIHSFIHGSILLNKEFSNLYSSSTRMHLYVWWCWWRWVGRWVGRESGIWGIRLQKWAYSALSWKLRLKASWLHSCSLTFRPQFFNCSSQLSDFYSKNSF